MRNALLVPAAMLAALCLMIATTGPAKASITIDFSKFPSNSGLTMFDDVTFSLIGGPSSTGSPTTSSIGGLTNTNDYGGYPTANILDFAFSKPVDTLSFVFNNEGSSFSGRGDSFYEAFAGSTLVSSGAINTAENTSFTVAGSGITDLQFNNGTAGTDSWWFQVNSVTFTEEAATVPAVPEPASMALLGAALVGLGLIRRRRV